MKRALIRWIINWCQASDRPLPDWVQRVCERDPELASERAAGDALSAALSRRPSQPDVFAGSRSMADRVLRQITEEDYQAAQAPEKSGLLSAWDALRRYGSVAAMACLLAVGGLLWWQGQEPDAPAQPAIADKSGQTDSLRLVVITTPVDLPLPELPAAKQSLVKLEQSLAKANPLDQEIEHVIADGKRALDFLTKSFVPSRFQDDSADQA